MTMWADCDPDEFHLDQAVKNRRIAEQAEKERLLKERAERLSNPIGGAVSFDVMAPVGSSLHAAGYRSTSEQRTR
jgi:hypothetical protein